MALGEFRLFQFKSKKQTEKEDRQYAEWAFPYGDIQRENLTNLIGELVPKSSLQICLATYLTCKELYEGVRENSDSTEEATEKMLKTVKSYGQLIRAKEMPLYLALVLADAETDEACIYPSADEIREQIQKFEEIRKAPKIKTKKQKSV